jgi:hypothetical protein
MLHAEPKARPEVERIAAFAPEARPPRSGQRPNRLTGWDRRVQRLTWNGNRLAKTKNARICERLSQRVLPDRFTTFSLVVESCLQGHTLVRFKPSGFSGFVCQVAQDPQA